MVAVGLRCHTGADQPSTSMYCTCPSPPRHSLVSISAFLIKPPSPRHSLLPTTLLSLRNQAVQSYRLECTPTFSAPSQLPLSLSDRKKAKPQAASPPSFLLHLQYKSLSMPPICIQPRKPQAVEPQPQAAQDSAATRRHPAQVSTPTAESASNSEPAFPRATCVPQRQYASPYQLNGTSYQPNAQASFSHDSSSSSNTYDRRS